MLPREPFQRCQSERPSWRHTTVVLSVEVGARTAEAIQHETGIELDMLRTVLADLEARLYITRIDGRYHRPANRGAIVPPPSNEVQIGH
jgi:FAD/FMN-containing dehydrogenase